MSIDGLYQTLSVSIPKKDLSPKNQKILHSRLSNLEKKQNIEAVYRLITSHAINTGEKDIEYPYSASQDSKGLSFDLLKLPMELQWVLWKFCEKI